MNHSTKDQLIENLEESFHRTIEWIREQPEERFNEEIIAGKWTIAGHLYHLSRVLKL